MGAKSCLLQIIYLKQKLNCPFKTSQKFTDLELSVVTVLPLLYCTVPCVVFAKLDYLFVCCFCVGIRDTATKHLYVVFSHSVTSPVYGAIVELVPSTQLSFIL